MPPPRSYKIESIREKMAADFPKWEWDEQHSLPHLDLWYFGHIQARLFCIPARGGDIAFASEQSVWAFCGHLGLDTEAQKEFVVDLLHKRGGEYLGAGRGGPAV